VGRAEEGGEAWGTRARGLSPELTAAARLGAGGRLGLGGEGWRAPWPGTVAPF
jgi:hypothetical protein